MDAFTRRRAIRRWLRERPLQPAPQPPRRLTELRTPSPLELDSIIFRRRRLPHWELTGATYFVTFNVLRRAERPFAISPRRFEAAGRRCAATLAEETILFGIGQQHDLDAYVVMPDHVHLLIAPHTDWSLGRILHNMKSISSLEINRLTDRRRQFWQDESFDHLIRGEADWLDKREYIHRNPVAGGLVAAPGDHPLSSAVTLDPPGRRESLRRLLVQPCEGRQVACPTR